MNEETEMVVLNSKEAQGLAVLAMVGVTALHLGVTYLVYKGTDFVVGKYYERKWKKEIKEVETKSEEAE